MTVQAQSSLGSVSEQRRAPLRWVWAAIAIAVIVNLGALVAYQHYLAVDFPFQDEIGYVNRLHHLPDTGFFHYLFDPYFHYFMPTQLFIWFDFYALTHLNIMVVRYTAAVISALASLLLCVMLYRTAANLRWSTIVAILCGPFLVCSYNHWASYDQSIEAVVEPLLFGSALALTWIAEMIRRSPQEGAPTGKRLGLIGLFVVIWVLASGIGPPPLMILAAFVGARVLLERRFDRWLILLGIVAVIVPALYVIAGRGLEQGFSASYAAFGVGELIAALHVAVGIVGNSLYSPMVTAGEHTTMMLGVSVIVGQIAAVIYALRAPREERPRFIVALTLTLYSWLVLLEIIGARLHETGVAFTPRYSMFGLYAPVSLLFWFVAMADTFRLKKVFGVYALVVITLGITLADAQTLHQLPYARAALGRVRATLLSLRDTPTPQQRAIMFVNPPLLDLVYPDLQFLAQQHLAMYQGQETTAALPSATSAPVSAAAAPPAGALSVIAYGPTKIRAGTPFNVQPDGSSAIWIETSTATSGDVYIVINGVRLPAHHRDNLVAAVVPPSLYGRAGVYKMYVLETTQERSTESQSVDFIVH